MPVVFALTDANKYVHVSLLCLLMSLFSSVFCLCGRGYDQKQPGVSGALFGQLALLQPITEELEWDLKQRPKGMLLTGLLDLLCSACFLI